LLQQQLGIPFPVVLQNTHVIDSTRQVRIGVVCAGPNRIALNASYQNKSNSDYMNDLGNLVINVCHVVPEGALLVFHSYSQMFAVLKLWNENGIFNRINREKQIFVEPRNAGELADVLREFAAVTVTGNGAILFCVCRGKVTEGVDLADNQCRAVIMAGIPFPAVQDRKVILKREYLDSKNGGDGGKWYRQEAARAVNQTIGRVIRHRRDYGVILLCDERFRSYVGTQDLPAWLGSQVRVYSNFGPVVKDIGEFFKNLPQDLLPEKKRSLMRQSSTSVALSGNGLGSNSAMWNADRQLESIQKLISSVSNTRVIQPVAPTMAAPLPLPAANFDFQAFKVSSSSSAGRVVVERKPSTAVTATENIPATIVAHQWIDTMKSTLNRRDYVILKRSLRRLLEGAHSECDITIRESLVKLSQLLGKANMIDSFDQVIAGSHPGLSRRWREINPDRCN